MPWFVPRARAAWLVALPLGAWLGCGGSSGGDPQAEAGPGDSGGAEGAALSDDGGAGEADAPDPLAVFAACPASRPQTGTLPADVAAVLEGKCQMCHQNPTKYHAPFPLLVYADTQAADDVPGFVGVPIWQVMHVVIQPDAVPHMPYGNAPQLTAAEMATLDGWLLACALPAIGVDGEAGADSGGDAQADGPVDAISSDAVPPDAAAE